MVHKLRLFPDSENKREMDVFINDTFWTTLY